MTSAPAIPACCIPAAGHELIDRGFVRDLEQDTEDAAIVSAIIALGNALKVQVVAEGVETPEQREFPTRCHSLQGFCWASR